MRPPRWLRAAQRRDSWVRPKIKRLGRGGRRRREVETAEISAGDMGLAEELAAAA